MIAPDSQRLFGSFDEQLKDLKLDSDDTESNSINSTFAPMESSQPSTNNGAIGAGINAVPGSTFRSNTPLLGNRHALSRTSSLMDSIGIQRAASPFAPAKEPFIPQNPGVVGTSFWHSDHPESRVGTPVQQIPLLQRNESTSSFGYAANLGMNLSTHSLAVDITPLGTPTIAQSHAILFPSSDIPPALDVNGIPQFPTPISIESSWKYIDTQGQIHGPFTTQMMSQWYIGGYFASTLQVSRLGSTPETLGINDVFITLGELMIKLQKYDTDPFSTFDKVHAQPPITDPSNTNLPAYSNEAIATTADTMETTDNDIFKPLTHKNIWDMDSGTTVQEGDIELGSTVSTGQTKGKPKSEVKPKNIIEARKSEKAESMAKVLLEEQERQNQEIKRKEEIRLLKKQKQKEEQELLKRQKEEKEMLKKRKERETLEAEKQKQIENTIKNTQVQTVPLKTPKDLPSLNDLNFKPTPWASKVKTNTPVNNITKNVLGNTENKKEAPLNLQLKITKEEKEKQELKSVLNWANKSSTVPNSTIDIKSQFQKTSKNAKETPSPKDFEDPNFIEEQKKIWERVQNSSKQPKTTTSATTTTTSWTTVTSKTKNPAGTAVPLVSKSNTGLNPSTTITSSTVATSTTTTFASMNSISPRQEFIKWCKSQMRLNSGITSNNVLELLLSLPTGPESKELIEETIYANSDVMDGRRFATEFIRRRAECERQGSDPLSWNEALALSGNDDDDWEFQVVSKKKGRKH
ncbi:Smy2p [Saccharomyces eubayanus]|uniref:Smy2p n=1 Tax=Saccharomyces eubayanus TaxID=1080349 RepID=UPI0006C4EEB3|nr:SMY2-like protein [Saccharomyces eubayanus]KOH00489.1 SMY2-like protein [Saccharomyces eubayanus]